MRYALKVAYDGTSYCGWQKQNNGLTVQQKMEDAVYAAFNRRCTVTASGRTDSGVHAAGQVCHADIECSVAGEKLADALNVHLPQDISVLASCVAPEGFDANRSAKKKTYVYNLYLSQRRNPLRDRYSVFLKNTEKLDIDKMRLAAALFVGEHDFKAYCASGSRVLTTVRTVYSAEVTVDCRPDCTLLRFTVCGNGFLYNMVRTMAGTLLYCGYGRISLAEAEKTLTERNRSLVGKTMPPNGLVLREVDYGFPLFPD